ncbi:MAG TPA: ECF transporter S component [Candidatus Acidoferrales bacterium]|nr:ECF transporter S component [Candidatus Acidoferrales bacterium]
MSSVSPQPRVSRPYFSTFELLVLGMFAAVVAVANLALRLPVKMPGHSGVVWMALLITASAVVPKRGAATVVASLSAFIAVLLGIGDKGALDTALSYTAAGVGVDAVLIVLRRAGGPAVCAVAGAAGNLAKLAVKTLLDLWIGIPAGFVVAGRLIPALTHAIFGLVGGYLGFLVVAALRRAGFFTYLAEKR